MSNEKGINNSKCIQVYSNEKLNLNFELKNHLKWI